METRQNQKRPNILFFLADQHRYDCVGSSNKYPVKTPNIDALAKEGALFTQAYTPTPVCAPARQSFLSGRRPESFGAMWNYNFIKTNTITQNDENFPSLLAKNGYENIFIGAWDGSTEPAANFGLEHKYTSKMYNEYINGKYPDLKYKNGFFGEKSSLPFEDGRPHWYAARTCEEIERLSRQEKPWFIWVDGVDPHLPCRPSEPFYGMYEESGERGVPRWEGFGDKFVNKPYIQKRQLFNWRLENMTWEDWAPTVRCYYSMISQVDDAFGRILQKLKDCGLDGETIVIYTSDHGDMCGSHGMIDKHYVLYDDVIRVPLVIRSPGAKKGTVIEEFVYNCLDLAPTLGELCGFEMEKTHGKSLIPLIEKRGQQGDDFTVSASSGQQFGLFTQRSVRTRDYKYIWNLTDVDEFYDLNADPGEKTNLINKENFNGLIHDMRRKLKNELSRCGDPFVKSDWLSRQLEE